MEKIKDFRWPNKSFFVEPIRDFTYFTKRIPEISATYAFVKDIYIIIPV